MSEQQRQGGAGPDRPASDDVVAVSNASGAGRVVLVCEHATNKIPPEFNGLGLGDEALQSHIAWDLGALAVAQAMSLCLDAPLVAQRVSRLIYDCNRAPDAPDAIPEVSEYQDIPGNAGLSPTERTRRAKRFCAPFCDALGACIEGRIAATQDAGSDEMPVLVTVHSFTPVYKGQRRELDIGILHDSDARLADEMLKCAEQDGALNAMRNMPYGPEDGVTFTLARHALPHGLLNVMIEIRNDLIADAAAQQAMAMKLAQYVNQALAALAGKAGLAQVS